MVNGHIQMIHHEWAICANQFVNFQPKNEMKCWNRHRVHRVVLHICKMQNVNVNVKWLRTILIFIATGRCCSTILIYCPKYIPQYFYKSSYIQGNDGNMAMHRSIVTSDTTNILHSGQWLYPLNNRINFTVEMSFDAFQNLNCLSSDIRKDVYEFFFRCCCLRMWPFYTRIMLNNSDIILPKVIHVGIGIPYTQCIMYIYDVVHGYVRFHDVLNRIILSMISTILCTTTWFYTCTCVLMRSPFYHSMYVIK